VGGIIKTTNSGESWDLVFTPSKPQYVTGTMVSKNSILYAAVWYPPSNLSRRLFFYRSPDGGATWDTVYYPLSGAMSVNDLLIIQGNRIDSVYFATERGGVFCFVNTITPVNSTDDRALLKDFSLQQNFPNPFNSSTTISYQLLAKTFVTLKIYDILGREVTTLVNEMKEPKDFTVTWNSDNQSSGVYFYVLRFNQGVFVKKMILLR
jgi:hypothetical protein